MPGRDRSWMLIVSLIPLVAAAACGVRSHWYGTVFSSTGAGVTVVVRSEYGQVSLSVNRSDPGARSRLTGGSWPLIPGWSSPHIGRWWRHWGFEYGVGGTAGGRDVRKLTVPYLALVAVAAGWPVVLWIRRRRRPAVSAGPQSKNFETAT